jgi:hypothetical protein
VSRLLEGGGEVSIGEPRVLMHPAFLPVSVACIPRNSFDFFRDTASYDDAEKLDVPDMHQGSVAESQRIKVAPASTSLAVTRPNQLRENKQCEKKTALLIGAARWTSVTSPSCLVQNVTHTAWQAWVPARSLASRCPQSTSGRRC